MATSDFYSDFGGPLGLLLVCSLVTVAGLASLRAWWLWRSGVWGAEIEPFLSQKDPGLQIRLYLRLLRMVHAGKEFELHSHPLLPGILWIVIIGLLALLVVLSPNRLETFPMLAGLGIGVFAFWSMDSRLLEFLRRAREEVDRYR